MNPLTPVKICLGCHRTDAFTPGKINHDQISHAKIIERNERLAREIVIYRKFAEEK